MIYFIQANAPTGSIKIGYCSSMPEKRLAELQCGCPYDLTVIGEIGGGLVSEKALHRRFQYARIRGEWFRPTADILALVDGAKKKTWESVKDYFSTAGGQSGAPGEGGIADAAESDEVKLRREVVDRASAGVDARERMKDGEVWINRIQVCKWLAVNGAINPTEAENFILGHYWYLIDSIEVADMIAEIRNSKKAPLADIVEEFIP